MAEYKIITLPRLQDFLTAAKNLFALKSHTHTKSEVGLENVDNTEDSAKSVKYAASSGNANTVNNHSVNSDVPSDAVFTDTWRPQPDWNASSGDAMIINKPTITKVSIVRW